jgi:hypothetical protein
MTDTESTRNSIAKQGNQIDRIESMLSKIHDSIYQPDLGLYARIQSIQSAQSYQAEEVTHLKSDFKSHTVDDKESIEEVNESIQITNNKINQVSTTLNVVKWGIATLIPVIVSIIAIIL